MYIYIFLAMFPRLMIECWFLLAVDKLNPNYKLSLVFFFERKENQL